MSPVPWATLDDLIERYDVFLVDQFGVLRDDEGLYAGAAEALAAVKAAGRTVVILSNSGRSGADNARRIEALGLPSSRFDHFVTSGDVGLELLRGTAARLGPEARCLTVSSAGAPGFGPTLGMKETGTGRDADLVVITGSEAERIPMGDYAVLLRPAASRGVACVCLNPDIAKLWQGTSVPAAGAIADLYETLGSTKVLRIGKPFADIYRHALRLVGEPDRSRVVCVGDSIAHDIVGASGAGLASVLVSTGLAEALTADEEAAAFARHGVRPTHRMRRFGI